jgi:hypothetical protein
MHPARLYVLFTAVYHFGIGLTFIIYVPFLLGIGLNLSDVAIINTFFMFTLALAEVPTGMLADGRSRGWSIRTGILIHTAGLFVYAAANGFWGAVAGEAVVGLGSAFISGANQAWLVEAMINRGERHLVDRAIGASTLAMRLAGLAGGLVGVLVGLLSPRLDWVLAGVFGLAAWTIARKMNGDGEPVHRVSELQALKGSLAAIRRDRSLVWALTALLIMGLVSPFNYYWSPFFGETAGDLSLAGIWPIFYGATIFAGWLIRRRGLAAGQEPPVLVLSVVLAGLGMALIGRTGGLLLMVVCAAGHEIGRGFFEPALDIYTQRRSDSSWRATFGSLLSLLRTAGIGLVTIFLWALTRGRPNDAATITAVWLICGLMMAAAAALLWLWRPTK